MDSLVAAQELGPSRAPAPRHIFSPVGRERRHAKTHTAAAIAPTADPSLSRIGLGACHTSIAKSRQHPNIPTRANLYFPIPRVAHNGAAWERQSRAIRSTRSLILPDRDW